MRAFFMVRAQRRLATDFYDTKARAMVGGLGESERGINALFSCALAG